MELQVHHHAGGLVTTLGKRKRIMREFTIDEISAVDTPAQEGALASIAKSRYLKTTPASNVQRLLAESADEVLVAVLASLEQQIANLKARQASNQSHIKSKKEPAMDVSHLVKARYEQLRKSHGPRNAGLKVARELHHGSIEKRSSFQKSVDAKVGSGMKHTDAMRAARLENPLLYRLHQCHAEKFGSTA